MSVYSVWYETRLFLISSRRGTFTCLDGIVQHSCKQKHSDGGGDETWKERKEEEMQSDYTTEFMACIYPVLHGAVGSCSAALGNIKGNKIPFQKQIH